MYIYSLSTLFVGGFTQNDIGDIKETKYNINIVLQTRELSTTYSWGNERIHNSYETELLFNNYSNQGHETLILEL